jgi:hypothetical protein
MREYEVNEVTKLLRKHRPKQQKKYLPIMIGFLNGLWEVTLLIVASLLYMRFFLYITVFVAFGALVFKVIQSIKEFKSLRDERRR